MIVGFPGESEEEFNQTYQWIKEMHFNQLHVFSLFSKKRNTSGENERPSRWKY